MFHINTNQYRVPQNGSYKNVSLNVAIIIDLAFGGWFETFSRYMDFYKECVDAVGSLWSEGTWMAPMVVRPTPDI